MKKKVFRSNDYDRKIQFFKLGEPKYNEETGLLEPTFEEHVKIWCSKIDLLRENLEKGSGGGIIARKRTQLVTRYRTDIDETMRFYVAPYTYEIISVGSEDGDSHETVIYGEAIENGGW